MGTYGKSYGVPTTPTTEEDVAANTASIKALADGLRHLRRKVASDVDRYVEPDDIRTDDALKNLERNDE